MNWLANLLHTEKVLGSSFRFSSSLQVVCFSEQTKDVQVRLPAGVIVSMNAHLSLCIRAVMSC